MPRPDVSEVAEYIYAEISPAFPDDEANDWAMLRFVHGWTIYVQKIEDVVRSTDDGPGWSSVLDAERAPDEFLNWLGQFTGVQPMTGRSPDQTRELILGAVRLRRGGAQASRAEVLRYLTGDKLVVFQERKGSAWRYAVRTRTSETADPDAVERALLAQKPGGMLLDYSTFDPGEYNYSDIFTVYNTYAEIEADPDYVTYSDMLIEEPDIG